MADYSGGGSVVSSEAKKKLALEALDTIRYELLMRMPYLEMVLFCMPFQEVDCFDGNMRRLLNGLQPTGSSFHEYSAPFGTDGRYLYFDAIGL